MRLGSDHPQLTKMPTKTDAEDDDGKGTQQPRTHRRRRWQANTAGLVARSSDIPRLERKTIETKRRTQKESTSAGNKDYKKKTGLALAPPVAEGCFDGEPQSHRQGRSNNETASDDNEDDSEDDDSIKPGAVREGRDATNAMIDEDNEDATNAMIEEDNGSTIHTGIPLAAEVADEAAVEAQLRERIFQEAVQADVITPGEDQDEDPQGLWRRKDVVFAGCCLFILVPIILGISIPLAARKVQPSTTIAPSSSQPTTSQTPTYFPSETPSLSPTGLMIITIVLQLGSSNPEETGWRLDCEPHPIFVPPGNYQEGDENRRIEVPVEIGLGQECEFTVLDTGDNGMGEGGFYEVYYGDLVDSSRQPFAHGGEGDFGSQETVLIVGEMPPTSAPTASPAPSISFAPSNSPPVPVTIVIQMKDLLNEIGWSLECDGVVYADVPLQTYGSSNSANHVVEETYHVQDGSTCRFAVKEVECCPYGESSTFRIYLADGQVQSNLVGSGEFVSQQDNNLSFEAQMLEPPSAAPTRTVAPTQTYNPTQAPTITTWIPVGDVIRGPVDSLDSRGFGDPIILSGDGSVVAIAAGFTRILRYDKPTQSWKQLGQDIQGLADDSEEKFITLSYDGTILALGATTRGVFQGTVRVFQYNPSGNFWTQLGRTIEGARDEDDTLTPISLSSDGSTLAIGERDREIDGIMQGWVRVYRYSPTTNWEQVGNAIVGRSEDGSWFGNSVSLSSDGSVVAVGAPFDGDDSEGRVYAFQFNQSSSELWEARGQEIIGYPTSEAGTVVSLSGDGSTVTIGAPYANHVRVYRYISNSNEWVQLGQDFEAPDAGGYFFGGTTSISYDGDIVAVVEPFGGPTQIFRYGAEGNQWHQLGTDITFTGISISISSDGRVVAVGDYQGDHVAVFRRN
jgi:hypothetical protein